MSIWAKIKKFFQGPICIKCHKHKANNLFAWPHCINCYVDNLCIIQKYKNEVEKENRINEMAEAIRRACPVAIKDVSNG